PNLLALFRTRGSDQWRDRRSGQMIDDETVQRRQVNGEPTGPTLHVGKPSFCCETPQFVPARDLPGRAKLRRGCIADEPDERFADRSIVESYTVPDAERETSTVVEHAAHLPQRDQLVGKELQSLLTQNHIEACIRQLKIGGVPLKPFDRRADRCRERSR